MRKINIKVKWICDNCGKKKIIKFDHEPDEYKDEYPFERPYGWWGRFEKDYCSIKCLEKKHPETKDAVWMA